MITIFDKLFNKLDKEVVLGERKNEVINSIHIKADLYKTLDAWDEETNIPKIKNLPLN